MKEKFKGYYKLNEKQIQEIWKAGFISLDTNVLFNLYHYSDDTRKELINKLSKYSDRLWLTYHAAYEFHKNRIGVINIIIKSYQDTIDKFTQLEKEIVKNLKSPHLSKPVQGKFQKNITETIKDLEKRKKFYKKLLTNDSILNVITKLFKNKVGDEFSKDELGRIEKEGEERYKNKIPPGYEDNKKYGNKFGDLIIWKELIRKSKTDNISFILLTDDQKEDWWLRSNGDTLSPRQELSQELYKETKKNFYLYTPDKFLEWASKGSAINQAAINEVREVQKEFNPERRNLVGKYIPNSGSYSMFTPDFLASFNNQQFSSKPTIYGFQNLNIPDFNSYPQTVFPTLHDNLYSQSKFIYDELPIYYDRTTGTYKKARTNINEDKNIKDDENNKEDIKE